MMARIDKSLLKLWVWFIACIIAYNPEPLAGESPDIDVAMTIPELDLPCGVVSADILKFCRLVMYTIPMDTYSSDSEKNSKSSIPVTSYFHASSIVTGMGPKCNSSQRKAIEGRIGTRVIDIVDVLP